MTEGIVDRYAQNDQEPDDAPMLSDLEERLRQAEEDGAEIAMRAEETERALREEIARLTGNNRRDSLDYCVSCRQKALVLASIIAVATYKVWFERLFPNAHSDRVECFCGWTLTAFMPVCVAVEWFIREAVKDLSWYSWKDNYIYHDIKRFLS